MEQQLTLQQVLNSCEIACTYACQTKNCASCPLFYSKMNMMFNNFETLAGSVITPQQMPNFELINKWLQEQEENVKTKSNPSKPISMVDPKYVENKKKDKKSVWPTYRYFSEAIRNRPDIRERFNKIELLYRGTWIDIRKCAKESGVDPVDIRARLFKHGWSVEDALETPSAREKVEDANSSEDTEEPKKLKYSGNKSFVESSSKQKFPKYKSFSEAEANRNDIKKEGSQYLLYYKGAWVAITAAAKEFDINPDTLRYRIWNSGWSIEDAIETPVNKIKSGAAEKKSGKPYSKASEQSSDLEKKVVDLYSNTTTKVADIINTCGINMTTFYKILNSNNVPKRGKGYAYKYSKKAKSVTIDNPKCDQWKRSMYDKMQQAAQKFRDKHHNDRKARITQSDVQHATIKKMTDVYGFVLDQARKEVFSSTVYTPETRPSVLEIIYNCPSDVTYKGSTMSWSECFDVCLTEVIRELNKK